MRFLVLLCLAALLAFPAAGSACDRYPGNPATTAAELSITRSALAVVHIGATPKLKPKHRAAKAGYGY